MTKRIDILTVEGSPRFVTEKTIYGDGVQLGVGGAELALLTMCRAWKEHGYDVHLYNNPREPNASCFAQHSQNEFDPNQDRDILIYFRGPNRLGLDAKGKKVWWSCDQYTIGDYRQLALEVDNIVTISTFHAEYFKNNYGITDVDVIDIPVREWDYTGLYVERNPMQVLFCSVPDRGLLQLAPIWDKVVKEVPEAQLFITSDWRLWDSKTSTSAVQQYRLAFAGLRNVNYLSLVSREELVKLQLQSSIHLYPCIYEELFCISVAETQYAGCFPITSSVGALSTTNMGLKTQYPPTTEEGKNWLVENTINVLTDPNFAKINRNGIGRIARQRFGIKEAIEIWDTVFFG